MSHMQKMIIAINITQSIEQKFQLKGMKCIKCPMLRNFYTPDKTFKTFPAKIRGRYSIIERTQNIKLQGFIFNNK